MTIVGLKEATEQRGLLNYRTTADCMPHLLDKKNVEMLTAHKVFSNRELQSVRKSCWKTTARQSLLKQIR